MGGGAINPLRISARGYRTFSSLDVDLPEGVTALVGANGSGKSSLLNAIEVALFAERGELNELLARGEDELEIALVFEHAGESYRVRRQLKAGKAPTCDFEKSWASESSYGHGLNETTAHANGWEPLTRSSAAETNELIAETLGLSRATFRASSFLGQDDSDAFTMAKPAERKAVLAEILGLDLWKRLQDRARTDLRGCEDELVKTQALIAGCQETASRKPHLAEELALQRSRLAAARRTLAEGEVEYEQAVTHLNAAETLAEKVRACEAELHAATEKHTRASEDFSTATKAAHSLADKQIELEELQADASRVGELEARLVALRGFAEMRLNALGARATLTTEADQRDLARARMVEQAMRLQNDANAARDKANHLMAHIGESEQCDRCGQTLGKEAAERAAESYAAEADDLNAKVKLIDAAALIEAAEIDAIRERIAAIEIPDAEDPAPTERILAAARRAAEQAASVRAQITHLAERANEQHWLEEVLAGSAANLAEKQTALDAAKETVVDLTAAQARAERWKIAVDEARGLIENRQADVVRAEAEYDRCVAAEEQLAEHRRSIEDLNARVDLLKLAEKAYGRDGIPALIVENAAVPQIELEANRVLQLMPTEDGTTFRIELHTQREKKDGALRDTLEVVIHGRSGPMRYENYSGGEKGRINVALRIALARLLAHRRGAESRLLVVDELPFLDLLGQRQLVEVIESVRGDYDRILLVAHESWLRESFDTTIELVNDGTWSRIVGEREQVAA